MNKSYLVQILDKYHLDGLVEKASLIINKNNVSVKTISELKNLFVVISAPDFELGDCEVPIYNTSQLQKLIKITDEFIQLSVECKKVIATKLYVEDNEYNLEYSLADPMMIPNIPTIEEPDYETEIELNSDFINKFIKGEKALDSPIFTVESIHTNKEKKQLIKFTLGGASRHENKITFNQLAVKMSPSKDKITFPIKEMKEILYANKDLQTGSLYISDEGLMKVEFKTETNISSTYLLVAKED